MWCKKCNIETNDTLCPICRETTVEDIPSEVYWCKECKVPVLQTISQSDKGLCPLCGKKMKYMATDLRPVFPEERLLLEILLGIEPNEHLEKSVWASNNRYYIDGKATTLPNKLFEEADVASISEKNK